MRCDAVPAHALAVVDQHVKFDHQTDHAEADDGQDKRDTRPNDVRLLRRSDGQLCTKWREKTKVEQACESNLACSHAPFIGKADRTALFANIPRNISPAWPVRQVGVSGKRLTESRVADAALDQGLR